MQVAAGHLSAALVHHGRPHPGDSRPTPSQGPESLVEAAALRNGSSETVTETEQTVLPHRPVKGKGSAPVSLIESGHFKGVADLRLRLNFAGRLAERAEERVREGLVQGAESLTELVRQQSAKVGDAVSAGPEKLTELAGLTEEVAKSLTQFAATTSVTSTPPESVASSFT